ncbi:MAG: hypothetical protein LUE93_12670 [Bacteroides sp.]|nr:hypothetical protein [Bacteroides sp.]
MKLKINIKFYIARLAIAPNIKLLNSSIKTIPITASTKPAFAKLALVGGVLPPKAQIHNITIPTTGIAIRIRVIIYSPTPITG